MSLVGSYTFLHKYFDVEPDVIETNKKTGLFDIKKKNKKIRIKENHEQIWDRINKFIIQRNLTIINFEAIYKCDFRGGGGGDYCYNISISNNDIIGYRMYYKTQIIN